MIGVVSVRLSKTLIVPRFSATKIRPSGENWMTDGWTSPLRTAWSWKPVGTDGCQRGRLAGLGVGIVAEHRPAFGAVADGRGDGRADQQQGSQQRGPDTLTRRRNPIPPDPP